MQENLRFYLQQITRAQEEERKRIARDLHDETAQALYAVNRQVDNFMRSGLREGADAGAFCRDLSRQIVDILYGVRRFNQDLRPPMLDDLGLVATLRWLVSELKEKRGLTADLRVLGTERRLSAEAELTMFRIVQEALRNVEKHAHASRVDVELEFGEGKSRVTIRDDGQGFDLRGSLAELPRMGKLGLAGMEERVRLLGGTLTLESQPGEGTSVVVEVPT